MKRLTELESKDELKKYTAQIQDAFERAVKDANRIADICFTKRTRAGMIRDFAVQYLKQNLTNIGSVQILEKDNTILFRFGESLLGRVKKLDTSFNASYNHTNSSSQFTSQQLTLFGDNYRLTTIHIGYVLDEFGIGIENILITCPVNSGKGYDWILPISADKATNITTDLTVEENENHGTWFRIKSQLRESKSQNDRTGTGG